MLDKKQKENKEREERIAMEIVADAHDSEERAMGWHCYLEDVLRFPFRARCINIRSISPLAENEEVEVAEIASGDECEAEIFVTIKWQGRKLSVPLVQLEPIDTDEKTKEAVGDWHYWVSMENEF